MLILDAEPTANVDVLECNTHIAKLIYDPEQVIDSLKIRADIGKLAPDMAVNAYWIEMIRYMCLVIKLERSSLVNAKFILF